MDNLWLDLAVRGELDLGSEVLARFRLSDGAEPDPEEDEKGREMGPFPEV